MNIIKDKDPIWETEKYDVILVGTSIYCMLTNGFQSKIRFKYPHVDDANNKTPFGDKRKLGKRLTVEPIEDGQPIISLLYIANYPHSKRVFVDYEALENALATANAEFKGKKVMTTLLGESAFDGNGDREKLLKIIEKLGEIAIEAWRPRQLWLFFSFFPLGRRHRLLGLYYPSKKFLSSSTGT